MQKKILFSMLAGCCLALTSSAQVAIKPAIGINATDFSKDPASGEYKGRIGYQIGGSVAIGKKVYFEPGIFYVKKTTEYVTESTPELENQDFNISGIRVPLTIGFNLLGNQSSVVGLRGFGGVSAFFLTDIKDLNKDDFKSASWGTYLGVGLDVTIVFVEASYEWSLTNLQKNIETIDVGKTRSLFVHAGVRIPIGGK
ncbi:porin family protein [Flavihumibacter sp. CACIAM 22H1]|uniref:porin family protein n=1 Tax=Flavihumibacter sp. CACIAM 22H1 TaxID=1812911 RepID=UPI0007A92D86|nr:porin family protein [Flavihumibacter sp. CACIAM 22H1]KYP14268.1 MAG: hypothetical protein A1D16_17630 [Flavihumibacter sp. CACIAM 22H1]